MSYIIREIRNFTNRYVNSQLGQVNRTITVARDRKSGDRPSGKGDTLLSYRFGMNPRQRAYGTPTTRPDS